VEAAGDLRASEHGMTVVSYEDAMSLAVGDSQVMGGVQHTVLGDVDSGGVTAPGLPRRSDAEDRVTGVELGPTANVDAPPVGEGRALDEDFARSGWDSRWCNLRY
jgi:hypothetical protein